MFQNMGFKRLKIYALYIANASAAFPSLSHPPSPSSYSLSSDDDNYDCDYDYQKKMMREKSFIYSENMYLLFQARSWGL